MTGRQAPRSSRRMIASFPHSPFYLPARSASEGKWISSLTRRASRYNTTMRFLPPTLFLCLLATHRAAGDEAILLDGRRLQGTLSSHEKRWVFLPTGDRSPVSLTTVKQ